MRSSLTTTQIIEHIYNILYKSKRTLNKSLDTMLNQAWMESDKYLIDKKKRMYVPPKKHCIAVVC